MGPPDPPGPRPEPNAAQAALVALLNLSGLGLGYALLRHWRSAALCWAATVALLVAALPADVDGVPAGIVAGYAVVLAAAAADGARRGLRAPLAVGPGRVPVALPTALALAMALLVVPVGGSVAYGAAQDEAVERSLLDRLAAADELVADAEGQSFTTVQADYDEALKVYTYLGTERSGSRAGRLVPDRLRAYYRSVSAFHAERRYCEAVPGLVHLRALDGTLDRSLLKGLRGRADEPLAQSWYECGISGLGGAGSESTAAGHLNALLATFPESPHAGRVEPAVRQAVRTKSAAAVGGAEPCVGGEELRRVATTVGLLPKARFGTLGQETQEAVRKGDFACGVDQFKDKEYTEAARTMTEYTRKYGSSREAGQARNIATAAEIADEDPAAGRSLPPAGAPGGPRMVMVVSNDGPGEVELLYTGPVTGRITLRPCASCRTYGGLALLDRSAAKPCSGPSSKYPRATLLLPAGTYHFLQKRSQSSLYGGQRKASTTKVQSGYTYTNCLYVTTSLPGIVPLPRT
ncbi:hypothetical protein ABZO31_09375 [Streptomyces sp. HUAS MG47]|uniref:hypothetical protein n=1 Tax=Streptomyces solicamelliae TaxID=3231716 RepID=UPI003877B368